MTYQRRIFKTLSLTLLAATALSVSGCKTVSEDTCLAGNWEAVGFKDGTKGKSANRLSKIAEACTKFGTSVDNQAYLAGYDAGLPKYCTFQRGFERGEGGSSYNQICSGELAAEYAPGYEEGRVRYEIYQGHEQLVGRYEEHASALYHVRERLRNDELSDSERKRLRYKERRLENEIDDIRYDIRDFERRFDLPRTSLGRYSG